MRFEDRSTIRRMRRAVALSLGAASLFAVVLCSVASEARAFSAADVYRNTSSSVVLIFGFSDSGAGSSGTGSIISRDGLVLTNNHVVTDSETGRLFPNLVVYFKPVPITGDNRKDLTTPFLVDVISRDPDLDLALLRVKEAPGDLRPVEIADSEEVDIGESVAAIGHPGGGGLWTLTTGTISSKRRDSARDIFQTDTAINPGNSGQFGRSAARRVFATRRREYVRSACERSGPSPGRAELFVAQFASACVDQPAGRNACEFRLPRFGFRCRTGTAAAPTRARDTDRFRPGGPAANRR